MYEKRIETPEKRTVVVTSASKDECDEVAAIVKTFIEIMPPGVPFRRQSKDK